MSAVTAAKLACAQSANKPPVPSVQTLGTFSLRSSHHFGKWKVEKTIINVSRVEIMVASL